MARPEPISRMRSSESRGAGGSSCAKVAKTSEITVETAAASIPCLCIGVFDRVTSDRWKMKSSSIAHWQLGGMTSCLFFHGQLHRCRAPLTHAMASAARLRVVATGPPPRVCHSLPTCCECKLLVFDRIHGLYGPLQCKARAVQRLRCGILSSFHPSPSTFHCAGIFSMAERPRLAF
jgi:hypothetical protein